MYSLSDTEQTKGSAFIDHYITLLKIVVDISCINFTK